MEGDSKQVRAVIRKVFEQEKVSHGTTWSDAGRGMSSANKLHIAWDVGHKVIGLLPKVQAAMKAAGYNNVVTQTQDTYLRVTAPRG
jgi:hypothetical protein